MYLELKILKMMRKYIIVFIMDVIKFIVRVYIWKFICGDIWVRNYFFVFGLVVDGGFYVWMNLYGINDCI